jgi:hypothetical protein
MEDLDRNTEPSEDTTWEPNPLPLMTKHSPRITVSNTKIQLEEGILRQPHPKGENDLGWVQLQQKSLLWEKIEGSSVVTHEDLTTMSHSSRMGWTIMSGTWNHLRKVWGPTPDTLARIQTSCKSQESLEEANVFTPTSRWSTTGFCNLSSLKWLTGEPLTPTRLEDQRTRQSHKVAREEEGLSSTRPKLVALWECLVTHQDHENLLYLTDVRVVSHGRQ